MRIYYKQVIELAQKPQTLEGVRVLGEQLYKSINFRSTENLGDELSKFLRKISI